MAGTRTLGRTRLDKGLVERCHQMDIYNCGQLLRCSVPELVQRLDIWPEVARQMLIDVGEQIVTDPVTSLRLSQRVDSLTLSTGVETVDRALRGGIAARSITEIVGPAGVGKTQFAMMLACRSLVQHMTTYTNSDEGRAGQGKPPGVVYIDTEGAFSAQRAMEITHAISTEAEEMWISQLHVYRVSNTKDLMELLTELEYAIIQSNIKLVALDSVAALVRKEFGRDTLVARQQLLGKQAAMLKRLAEEFGIPVIVTNQVTTAFTDADTSSTAGGGNGSSSGGSSGGGDSSELTAALGVSWAHFVNTRLALQLEEGPDESQSLSIGFSVQHCAHEHHSHAPISSNTPLHCPLTMGAPLGQHSVRRSLTVAKSPISPAVTAAIKIGPCGFAEVANPSRPDHQTSYMD